MSTIEITDINSIPLDRIDVRQPDLFKNDNWQPLFARLRNEAPVHYLADSVNGPFWSITSHEMIKAVDSNSVVFSSGGAGNSRLSFSVVGTASSTQPSQATSALAFQNKPTNT